MSLTAPASYLAYLAYTLAPPLRPYEGPSGGLSSSPRLLVHLSLEDGHVAERAAVEAHEREELEGRDDDLREVDPPAPAAAGLRSTAPRGRWSWQGRSVRSA